jgi:predicted small integral membrane protein
MSDLGWTFSLAIVFLGASAAIFGHWLEKAGPRKAGVAAAFAGGGGLIITSLGVTYINYGLYGLALECWEALALG